MSNWPFQDDPSTIVITTAEITSQERPILYASHELDEDNDVVWQFYYNEKAFDFAQAVLVRLDTAYRIDPTLEGVAQLPIGYFAKRTHVGAEWEAIPLASADKDD